MAENSVSSARERRLNPNNIALLLLPVILLGGVIWVFLTTGGGLSLSAPVPVENLSIERTILKPGQIELTLRNSSPQELGIAQVIINDAVWPFTITSGQAIPRLGSATVHLDYHWAYGEAYSIRLFSSNSIPFDVHIPVAFPTPSPNNQTFLAFTLIGLYVGVIPVFLGLLWFPALRKLGRQAMVFLMAVTAGLLIFLGLDTVAEAFDQAGAIPGAFQSIGLIGIGAIGTFSLLAAISRRQAASSRSEASRRLTLAYMIAVGIGLHNLGEGLAIGAAFNVGEIALGTFLVVGFIIQNLTEGLGIIAPILRDRPGIRSLAWLGLLGGVPAILGAWIGGFSPSPILAVLFLAIGSGAVFEVVYEIAKMISRDTAREDMSLTIFSGIVSGMLLLWVTGLLIK